MTENNVKILSIEDNDSDFELLERKLKSTTLSYTLRRVQNEKELREAISSDLPDLILSDFSLPSFSGLEALSIINKEFPLIPFVFVSGTIGEERAVEALRLGALDYVFKDNLNKLEPAIIRALNESNEKRRRKEAEEKLKIKNEELKSLVYRISHDIRGPLCTIKGAVNLMWDEKKPHEETYLELIEQVLTKMDGVVINLSSFQFLYADKLTFSQVHLEELKNDLLQKLKDLDLVSDCDISITIKNGKEFYSDRGLLDSIFYNLIHNSVVFCDPNKAGKIIECEVNVSRERLQVVIEDNGIGFSDEVKSRAFDMFYRGSNNSKGAGLGLYIVKTAIERLNGTVEIISEENKGTKVLLNIPAASE